MKVDIGFIPQNLVTPELERAAGEKVEYPFIRNEIFAKTKRQYMPGSKSERFVAARNESRENYFSFEKELFSFAKNQYDEKNYEIAEQCFHYLMDIGSRMPKVKEFLVKIYMKEKETDKLNWIKTQIKRFLADQREGSPEHRQHLRLLSVYFNENFRPKKRIKRRKRS